MERVQLSGADIEYDVRGSGEAVVFIHGAILSDGFVPVIEQTVIAENFQVVHYRRRGYAGSSRALAGMTMQGWAGDCIALLNHLGIGSSQILWEDSERVFHRGWRLVDDGKRRAVLLIPHAADHPPRSTVDRLAHEREAEVNLTDIIWKAATIRGFTFRLFDQETVAAANAALLEFLKEGTLQPKISRVFPLSQAAEAVPYLIEDRPFGRILMDAQSQHWIGKELQ